MAELIDGKTVSKGLKERVKSDVTLLQENHNIIPLLHAILVGDDPASQTYVGSKQRTCERLGMKSEVHKLPEDINQRELESLIADLNQQSEVHGILVQLPLPKHIDQHHIMDKIYPLKDVDGFTSANIAKLYRGEDCLEPCTPKGILILLDYYEIPIEGKDVVIIGRSDIVGKPLYVMMASRKRNATVTLCHSKTKDIGYHTKNADIVVTAIGQANYLKGDMIREGSIIIDVGINRINDTSSKGYSLVGDVDFMDVSPKASYITPVPGGVGPMTIACLMENTLKACKLQNNL